MEDCRVLLDYGIRNAAVVHCVTRRLQGWAASSPVRDASPVRATRNHRHTATMEVMWNLFASTLDHSHCAAESDVSGSDSEICGQECKAPRSECSTTSGEAPTNSPANSSSESDVPRSLVSTKC